MAAIGPACAPGQVAEWLKAADCKSARVSRTLVRIQPCPPSFKAKNYGFRVWKSLEVARVSATIVYHEKRRFRPFTSNSGCSVIHQRYMLRSILSGIPNVLLIRTADRSVMTAFDPLRT